MYQEERKNKNIQAANRREEERQAGCHTSKTGTQLQQTAEITAHEGKRNRRCERHMYAVIQTQDRNRLTVLTAQLLMYVHGFYIKCITLKRHK